MLEATIGLNEVEPEAAADKTEDAALGEFTTNDLSFLRSLRITVSDDNEPSPTE